MSYFIFRNPNRQKSLRIPLQKSQAFHPQIYHSDMQFQDRCFGIYFIILLFYYCFPIVLVVIVMIISCITQLLTENAV